MNQDTVLYVVSRDELEDLFKTIVDKALNGIAPKKIEEDKLMSSKEAAKYLNISRPTLIKLKKNGLPFYSVGGEDRFKKNDIDNYTFKRF